MLIGPHGGALQNSIFMRQPGQWNVSQWLDDDTVGMDVGMGPGDPVPAVIVGACVHTPLTRARAVCGHCSVRSAEASRGYSTVQYWCGVVWWGCVRWMW